MKRNTLPTLESLKPQHAKHFAVVKNGVELSRHSSMSAACRKRDRNGGKVVRID